MPATTTAGSVKQTLSVADAVAIIVGIVVGAGIFETPPLVASMTGSALADIGVWCLGGVLSLLGVLCYAELATTYPDSGGIYYYIRRAFGDTPAFLLGWARLTVIQTGSIAMLGFVFGDYAARLASLGPHSASIYAALAVIVITLVNVRGVQFGRWTQNLLTLCKVLGLLAIVVAGLRMSPATAAAVEAAPGPSHSRFGLMMVFVLLTYGGWQEAGFISAELKQVRRSMTIALVGSIGLITAIFLLVNLALLHGLGLRGVAASTAVATGLLATLAPAQSKQKLRAPDVIFVPTPQVVVDEMLRLAKVSGASMVYDLGCGDGRLVITAAKQYGARGIGIDIDPQRIRESNENASAAKVTDRVKFILGDLFQFDFHEATAVTLYLLPDLNVKLRPTLMSQLKPGTPVVSHDFDMGDWTPDESKAVEAEGRTHSVFLWIVPAQAAGAWQWTMLQAGTNDRYALMLKQQFQNVTGTLTINGKESTVTNLNLTGDKLRFDTAFNHYEGRIDGDRMGLRTVHNSQEVGPIVATRTQSGVGAAN